MSEPAGWYGNPDGTDTQRYWDGSKWTHDVRPRPDASAFDPARTEASGPGPAPLAGAAPAVPPAPPTASVSDLIGTVFDFGMTRPVGPDLARTGYRVGAMATLVIAALFLLVGLQGGGIGAIVSVLAFPLLALLWLIGLRLLCQVIVDHDRGNGGPESA